MAEEVVSSIRTVRSFAGEQAEVERYSAKLLDTYRIQKRSAAAYAGYVWCSEVCIATVTSFHSTSWYNAYPRIFQQYDCFTCAVLV